MHDLVACCDRVVTRSCICYVGHASGSLCNKFITREKFSFCNGYFSVAVSIAVICPLIICCSNRNSHFSLRHGQLAVSSCNCVVVRISCCKLIRLELVGYWALARECDAAFYYRSDRITSYKSVNIIFRPALGFSCICERFILSCDRYGCRFDSKCTVNRCDNVVFGYIFFTVHDYVAICNWVVTFLSICYVSHASGSCCCESITCKQLSGSNSDRIVAVSTAVICPLLRCCRDSDGNLSLLHRQLSINSCHVIVVRISCCELIRLELVGHRTLTRERDAA